MRIKKFQSNKQRKNLTIIPVQHHFYNSSISSAQSDSKVWLLGEDEGEISFVVAGGAGVYQLTRMFAL